MIGRVQTEAQPDLVHLLRTKDVRPLSMTPKQDCALLSLCFFDLINRDRDGLKLIDTVWSYDGLSQVDLVRRFIEVHVFRDFPLKETNVGPADKMSCSGAAEILKGWRDGVVGGLPILAVSNLLRASSVRDNGPQLGASINLGVVSNLILLVDKPVAYSRSDDQKESENSYRASPADHLAIKPGLGAFAICIALRWIG